jgi:2-dehydropantoate 2-reductase
VGIDAVREGGRFSYARPGRIIFGPGPQGGDHSGCLSRLGEALGRAGIPYELAADIRRVMWWKFMINVGVNQASAVLRAPYGIFQSSPDAKALMRLLMEEVILLAEQTGINLQRQDLEEWLTVLATLSPEGKTSMLQDIEGGRKTEVEIFAGEVVAMGREHGIPTPVNEAVLHIIKVMEAGYLPGRARSTKQ